MIQKRIEQMLLIVRFTLLTFILFPLASTFAASYDMPADFNNSSKYLFFYHNYYVETKGPDGDCKYYDILKAFADHGFIVTSDLRPADVKFFEYIDKASGNIQKALDAGVPPENITVAGHSKGGVIAIQISAKLQEPKINYVILAGCAIKPLAKAYPAFDQLTGNFLSLYADSDTIAGSCETAFGQSKQNISSKESAIQSEAGHRLFFAPGEVWLEPMLTWLQDK